MPIVVVHQTEFCVAVLTTPLDGLGNIASRRTVGALAWQAVGGITVGGADVTVRAVELADVFG